MLLSNRTLRVEVILVVRVRCSGRLMVCDDRDELRESERESNGASYPSLMLEAEGPPGE